MSDALDIAVANLAEYIETFDEHELEGLRSECSALAADLNAPGPPRAYFAHLVLVYETALSGGVDRDALLAAILARRDARRSSSSRPHG
jgi:hypothetical protein